jgi:ArpU family phage transcriptional regulator
MEDYKETVYKAFKKRRRMRTIANSPVNQKLTQTFDQVIVQGGSRVNSMEKMIINKVDAQFYIDVLDKAIEELPNTQKEPYRTIIEMKYLGKYSRYEICRKIHYEIRSYHDKLKEAQMCLADIIDTWGLNVD